MPSKKIVPGGNHVTMFLYPGHARALIKALKDSKSYKEFDLGWKDDPTEKWVY